MYGYKKGRSRRLALTPETKPDKACRFFKALTNSNRWKIVAYLRAGPQCVCEIERSLKLSQNLISHHLKILEQAGVVDSERQGTKVYYHLKKQHFEEHLSLLQNFFS